jgi:hypothetical protein
MNRREFLARAATAAGAITVGGLPEIGNATGSILWGANCQPTRGQNQKEAVAAMEQRLDRRFGATHHRLSWDSELVNSFTQWSVQGGRVPAISWSTRHKGAGMVSWDSIARGDHDDWIRRQAQSLKSTGWSGYLAFHKEPENEGNASDWKAAYNRVHLIFDNVGVNRFRWLVTLTAATYSGLNGGPDVWLPNRWDLLGVDGANRNFCGSGNGWRSFADIYGPARTYAHGRNKKLYVQEYGCVESTSGRKADWIDGARAVLKNWPEVVGVSYLHENSDCNFRIDTSTSAFTAFKATGQDAYFKG